MKTALAVAAVVIAALSFLANEVRVANNAHAAEAREMGELIATVEALTKQTETMSEDLRAINSHFIVWASMHEDED